MSFACKIIAHRAGNSFHEAQKAIREGADILEADLHMTKDLVLVLNHQPYVESENGVKMHFSEYDRKDFKTVVLLEDMVEFVHKNKKKLLLDVKVGKTFYENIEQNLVNFIVSKRLENTIEVLSFDHVCIKKIINLSSQIRAGVMYVARLTILDYLLKDVKPAFLEICSDYLDDEDYTIAKENHIELYGWGTDSKENLLRYKQMEMSAITVNDVEQARKILNE